MRRYVRLPVSRSLLFTTLIGLLAGCGGPQPLNFPFDPGGRSLNSPFADTTPRMVGRYIVLASDRRGSQDIYLYDMADQRLVDLPGLNAIDLMASSPGVSETGRFIVFAGSRGGKTGIYLYDRDFRQLRNLTEGLRAEVRNPTISADGTTIAFESNARGQWDILLYNRAGQPLPGIDMEPR
jgi:Tol biopolymer transport system component